MLQGSANPVELGLWSPLSIPHHHDVLKLFSIAVECCMTFLLCSSVFESCFAQKHCFHPWRSFLEKEHYLVMTVLCPLQLSLEFLKPVCSYHCVWTLVANQAEFRQHHRQHCYQFLSVKNNEVKCLFHMIYDTVIMTLLRTLKITLMWWRFF